MPGRTGRGSRSRSARALAIPPRARAQSPRRDNGTVHEGDIEKAAAILRAGGLVAFPTETVYGLGADAGKADAVAKIFAAKGRPTSHPLIVHLADADMLGGWAARVPEAAHVLAERFWPGPLTMVLPRGERVSPATTGGQDTVAIRVPDHPVAHALLAAFGGGVAAPSANRFGSVSPTTAEHVRAGLGDRVEFVLDGGPCTVGVESTIVDLTGSEPTILRPGGVSREAIEAASGKPIEVRATSSVRVSGQLPSHYAPSARVVLVDRHDLVAEAGRARDDGRLVGVIAPSGSAAMPDGLQMVYRVPASMDDYARDLYDCLRRFDAAGCDVVFASLPEPTGLGLAIADRLRRAAGPRPATHTER